MPRIGETPKHARQERPISGMPRPVTPGIYNDGAYDWEWDGEDWELISPAPYGMPSYPYRRYLRRVTRTLTDLTDADFRPEPEPEDPRRRLERILTGEYLPDFGESVTVGGVTWTCADAGQGFPGWFRDSVFGEWIRPDELNDLIRAELNGDHQ